MVGRGFLLLAICLLSVTALALLPTEAKADCQDGGGWGENFSIACQPGDGYTSGIITRSGAYAGCWDINISGGSVEVYVECALIPDMNGAVPHEEYKTLTYHTKATLSYSHPGKWAGNMPTAGYVGSGLQPSVAYTLGAPGSGFTCQSTVSGTVLGGGFDPTSYSYSSGLNSGSFYPSPAAASFDPGVRESTGQQFEAASITITSDAKWQSRLSGENPKADTSVSGAAAGCWLYGPSYF
jgi:hypothetical protein